jgi:hypothetical protein
MPNKKQIGPRLTPTATEYLKALCAFHGMSATGLIEHLVRQAARQMADELAKRPPPGPITTMVSPEVDEDEANEMDGQRFRGLRASITRAALDRP